VGRPEAAVAAIEGEIAEIERTRNESDSVFVMPSRVTLEEFAKVFRIAATSKTYDERRPIIEAIVDARSIMTAASLPLNKGANGAFKFGPFTVLAASSACFLSAIRRSGRCVYLLFWLTRRR
jgi:hypothetical protein